MEAEKKDYRFIFQKLTNTINFNKNEQIKVLSLLL